MAQRRKPIPAEYRAYAGQPFAITKHVTEEQQRLTQMMRSQHGRRGWYGPNGEPQTFYGESVEDLMKRHPLIRGQYHVRALQPDGVTYAYIGDLVVESKSDWTLLPLTTAPRCKLLAKTISEEVHALELYKEKHGSTEGTHSPQDQG